ncbi:MAG: hypothetical protein ACRCT8_03295 [Lacipirellulaceae bacterium]
MINRFALLLVVAFSAVLCSARPAGAFTEFQKEFQKLHAGGEDKEFRKLARRAKCNACHQGKDRKNNNAYGDALGVHIQEKHKKDKKAIVAALKLVADQQSVADEPGSPTFGALMARGELPGGSLVDSKKEPPKSE